MLHNGGSAQIKDYAGLKAFLESQTHETVGAFREQVLAIIGEYPKEEPLKRVKSALYEYMHERSYGYSRGGVIVTQFMAFEEEKAKTIERIDQFFRFASDFEQEIRVAVWEDGVYAAVFLGNPDELLLIPKPERFLEYLPPIDRSGLSPAAVRATHGLSGGESLAIVPAGERSAMTVADAEDVLHAHEAEITALDEHYKKAQRGESEELIELKREMERIQNELDEKRRALLEQLEEKKAEMLVKKAQLESQVFMLDSEIYNIECYMGETVRFARIRSGKNAPDTEPIVVHQKLRFLDEDLGRLASIYEINWDQVGMFEEFLRYSPLALDAFAPNERCVMLVRLSKNAHRIGNDNDMPFRNMLKKYEVFHGKTVGIVIRNGENVYLGWTDDGRVHISDDLVLTAAQVHTEIVPDTTPEFKFKSDRDKWLAQQIENRKQILDGLVSRSFVFSVLQGIVDHTQLLPLPKGVKINKQSEYVQFSVADAWLPDNKYGSFVDLVKRCNERVLKGDIILTMQGLVAARNWTSTGYASHNDRGRGYNDRTHDVAVADCTLYPVNLVEYDDPVEMARYRFQGNIVKDNGLQKDWLTGTIEAAHIDRLAEGCEIIERYTKQARHVFVSLVKTDSSWRRPYWKPAPEREPRANFELYSGEYVNLTYMNSVWLEWVATTKNLGGVVVGGQGADYAHMIRYIKTALDFVRKREQSERAEIESVSPGFCAQHQNWPVLVSEFKLEKDVREISEYQAKRFVRWVVDR